MKTRSNPLTSPIAQNRKTYREDTGRAVSDLEKRVRQDLDQARDDLFATEETVNSTVLALSGEVSAAIDTLGTTMEARYQNLYDTPLEEPLYIWDGAFTQIVEGSDPETRVVCGGGATHNTSYWTSKYNGMYLFNLPTTQKTDGVPDTSSPHWKITLPVESGKNHSIMLCSNAVRYYGYSVWICGSDGEPAEKLHSTSHNVYGYGSYATSSQFNPYGGHSVVDEYGGAWFDVPVRAEQVDAYAQSGEITILLCSSAASQYDDLRISGIAIAVSKYGLLTIPAITLVQNYANIGGNALSWYGRWNYEIMAQISATTTYTDIRVNIFDPTKAVLLGIVSYNQHHEHNVIYATIGSERYMIGGAIGRYARNISARGIYRFPFCIIIPKEVVQENYITTNGMKQLPLDIVNPGTRPFYPRIIYTEIIDE